MPKEESVLTARHADAPDLRRIPSSRSWRIIPHPLRRYPSGAKVLWTTGTSASLGSSLAVIELGEVSAWNLNHASKMSSVGPNGLKYRSSEPGIATSQTSTQTGVAR